MEYLQENERRATPQEREEINRALFHQGLYNAALDDYELSDHPEDDQWIVRGEK